MRKLRHALTINISTMQARHELLLSSNCDTMNLATLMMLINRLPRHTEPKLLVIALGRCRHTTARYIAKESTAKPMKSCVSVTDLHSAPPVGFLGGGFRKYHVAVTPATHMCTTFAMTWLVQK